jgi:hypothetical protein
VARNVPEISGKIEGSTFTYTTSAPFLDRNDDGSVDSATGDYLWSVFEGLIDQLAETRFGVLQLPLVDCNARRSLHIRLIRWLVN